MKIPLIDLKTQYKSLRSEISRSILSVVKNGRYILGPEVDQFEKDVASFCGMKYAVGVASGTDALHLALKSFEIGPGDFVITSPFTFIATTETIIHCGAKPMFVDVDPFTFNIDPLKIPTKLNSKIKAILPVHLFGHPADIDKIMHIAKKNNLRVIEDCAQSMGALYKGGHTGSVSDCGTLSFFPTKNLGCFGDGGMVITNNKDVADKIRILRNHGSIKKYYYNLDGFNSRLDTIQAAILRVKLKHLVKWIEKRRNIASLYNKYLPHPNITIPHVYPYAKHSFNYYTVRIKNGRRNELSQYLAANNVHTEIYYPLCLHLQEVYKKFGYKKGDFPIAEQSQEEVLSLPIYPELTEREVKHVCKLITKFMR